MGGSKRLTARHSGHKESIGMAGLLTEEQLLRELRVLYANRPLQFTKLVTKYYKGERAKQILDTLKTWPSK